MIRLTRGSEPAVLRANKGKWTAEMLEALRTGGPSDTIRFRYRHPEIKEALIADASGKCIYCESRVEPVFPGDTEHIAPVSERPDLYVEWSNLALVCRRCNQSKGAYYDEIHPLLNPYVDDPDSHLVFLGPMILHRPGSEAGRRSTKRLELNRVALIERRRERLERLAALVDVWAATSEGPDRELLLNEIRAEAERDREYSATVKYYLRACRVPI